MMLITCEVDEYAGDAVSGVLPMAAPSIFTVKPCGFESIEYTLKTAGFADGNT
jgi:hypothetical protein